LGEMQGGGGLALRCLAPMAMGGDCQLGERTAGWLRKKREAKWCPGEEKIKGDSRGETEMKLVLGSKSPGGGSGENKESTGGKKRESWDATTDREGKSPCIGGGRNSGKHFEGSGKKVTVNKRPLAQNRAKAHASKEKT